MANFDVGPFLEVPLQAKLILQTIGSCGKEKANFLSISDLYDQVLVILFQSSAQTPAIFERWKNAFLLGPEGNSVEEHQLKETFLQTCMKVAETVAVEMFRRQKWHCLLREIQPSSPIELEIFKHIIPLRIEDFDDGKSDVSFVYKSLHEFLVARKFVREAGENFLQTYSDRFITEEPAILEMTGLILQERLTLAYPLTSVWLRSPNRLPLDVGMAVNTLLDAVKNSRKLELTEAEKICSSNAMSVLVKSKVNLGFRDFSNIKIPNANLSYGLFDHCSFECADLENCTMAYGSFVGCNFNNTTLKGCVFGLYPIYRKHTHEVTGIEWHPHNFALIASFSNASIHVFNIETGKEIANLLLEGASGATRMPGPLVRGVDWHPKDPQLMVVCLKDKTLRVVDIATGENLWIATGHGDMINDIQWHPYEHRLFASCSDDKTVRVWDFREKQEINKFHLHKDSVAGVKWHPRNPSLLASCSLDKTLVVINVQTGEEIFKFTGHTDCVTSLHWHPLDPNLLLSCSRDKTVRVIDIAKREEIFKTQPHTYIVTSIHWHPFNHDLFVSASEDKIIRLFSVKAPAPLKQIKGNRAAIRRVRWHPHRSTLLACCANDATVRFYTVDEAKQDTLRPEGHTDGIRGISWHPEEPSLLATCSLDNTVRIFNIETGKEVYKTSKLPAAGKCVQWNPHCSTLLAYTVNDRVSIVNVSDSEIPEVILDGHKDAVNAIDWNPTDPSLIATCCSDKTVRVFNSKTGEQVGSFNHNAKVNSVHWFLPSQDASSVDILASCSDDKTVRVFSISAKKELILISNGENSVNDVRWHPTKPILASCYYTKVVVYSVDHDFSHFKMKTSHEVHEGIVSCVRWNPQNPDMLMSCSNDKTLCLYNFCTKQLVQVVRGHYDWVSGIAWHPSVPNLVASCSYDKTIRVINLNTCEEEEEEKKRELLSYSPIDVLSSRGLALSRPKPYYKLLRFAVEKIDLSDIIISRNDNSDDDGHMFLCNQAAKID
eukprot:TRINITY_DN5197_c0_g2_i2.p1 TRINITY_DN5197_c0_g2~~TRINITY_DN5197_c0_g2_i2.p1  ORF type:complete len:999 (-),score=214.85 TRINITY_DN5197_c0_g2_i2:381-3377(-)